MHNATPTSGTITFYVPPADDPFAERAWQQVTVLDFDEVSQTSRVVFDDGMRLVVPSAHLVSREKVATPQSLWDEVRRLDTVTTYEVWKVVGDVVRRTDTGITTRALADTLADEYASTDHLSARYFVTEMTTVRGVVHEGGK